MTMMPPHWDPGAADGGPSKHRLPNRDFSFFDHLANFLPGPRDNAVSDGTSVSPPYVSTEQPVAPPSRSPIALQRPCASPSLLSSLPSLLRTTEFATTADSGERNKRIAVSLSAALRRGLKALVAFRPESGSQRNQPQSPKASSSSQTLGASPGRNAGLPYIPDAFKSDDMVRESPLYSPRPPEPRLGTSTGFREKRFPSTSLTTTTTTAGADYVQKVSWVRCSSQSFYYALLLGGAGDDGVRPASLTGVLGSYGANEGEERGLSKAPPPPGICFSSPEGA
ncbi:hypothetical protein CSUI_000663 [Cystoisospora suis]|uniref:Uncharacterized protein n=1 Tax=Cystoisospora suis TaxID=483139 RepID=A0A2C6LFS6_9APIC|nr:hypothetical protein CSUI_000663 [Cystoisospora suis]